MLVQRLVKQLPQRRDGHLRTSICHHVTRRISNSRTITAATGVELSASIFSDPHAQVGFGQGPDAAWLTLVALDRAPSHGESSYLRV